jgi:hypothetical protein
MVLGELSDYVLFLGVFIDIGDLYGCIGCMCYIVQVAFW